MTSPEIRYRRLLALYPRDFRREYEDEMLGVLMADPRPGPAQVFDVVRSALAVRLRRPFVVGGDWRRAAWVVQVFGAMLLFAFALRDAAMAWAEWVHPNGRPFSLDPDEILRLSAWAVVLAASAVGSRWLGAAGATAGLAGEIASASRYYLDTPATMLYGFWLVVAAAVALAAVLVARRGRRPRGWLLVALAGELLILQGAWIFRLSLLFELLAWLAAALAALGVVRQEPAVRRRVVALAVPIVVTMLFARVAYGYLVVHNMRHPEALWLLGPLEWAGLVLVPAVAFLVAAELNRRLEASRARFGWHPDGDVGRHE